MAEVVVWVPVRSGNVLQLLRCCLLGPHENRWEGRVTAPAAPDLNRFRDGKLEGETCFTAKRTEDGENLFLFKIREGQTYKTLLISDQSICRPSEQPQTRFSLTRLIILIQKAPGDNAKLGIQHSLCSRHRE